MRNCSRPVNPPLARVLSLKVRRPSVASPSSASAASAGLPDSSARTPRNCHVAPTAVDLASGTAVAVAKAEVVPVAAAGAPGNFRSRRGTANFAWKRSASPREATGAPVDDCDSAQFFQLSQPPCQCASSWALPWADASANTPDWPGNASIQRCSSAASSTFSLVSAAPSRRPIRPSICRAPPGNDRSSLPSPACTSSRAVTRPSTRAAPASTRKVLRSSVWRRHSPCVDTLSMRRPVAAAAPALLRARSATSNTMASFFCVTLAVPSTGAASRSLCSAASRTWLTVTLACQGSGAGRHRPSA